MDESDLVFLIMTVVTCVGLTLSSGVVEADSAESGRTGVQIVDDDDEYGTYYTGYWGHGAVARQMNGTLWTFDNFVTTPGVSQALWGHFSTDKGDTWSSIMIMDENDPEFAVGGYPRMIRDWCILSNNSIVLVVTLYAYDTTNNIELHFLVHWNNTDLSQWEEIDVYSHEVYDISWRRQPMVVVDDQDHVMVCYEQNGVHFDLYDMDTRLTINTYTKYPTVGSNYKSYLMCNSSGEFFYGYGNGASPEILYVYTGMETDTWSLVFSKGTSSSYYWYDCVVTADDTFVAVSTMSTGGWNKIYYYNGTGDGSRTYADGAHLDGALAALGLVASNPAWVTLMQYHKNEDRIATYANLYYRDQTIWQTTFAVAWDETEDTTKTHVWEGSRDLHPRIWYDGEWVYTQLPDTGWIFNFGDYDVAADDVDHWVIHLSSTTWQPIPYYTSDSPEIVTGSLDDGTFEVYYSFIIMGEGGETPYIWEILTGPAWLSIDEGTGEIYGTPDDTGAFPVRVRLTETHDAPRTDTRLWTLTIGSVEAPSEPLEPGRSLDFPGISIDTLIGALWWIFMVMAMFIAIIDVVMKTRNKLAGGQT